MVRGTAANRVLYKYDMYVPMVILEAFAWMILLEQFQVQASYAESLRCDLGCFRSIVRITSIFLNSMY